MISKRDEGLTLIEIIVVVFLFSIILASIFTVLATARNSCKSGASQLSVQQEARRGLNVMTKELRQARTSTISGVPPDGTDYSSITFQIPETISEDETTWSSTIQYSVRGLNNTQLLRVQDGNERVLANNVSALGFRRSTPETLDITITAQKNTFPGLGTIQSNLTLGCEVKIRN
jgi:type II secretory pathway pseudopilin PulG